MSDRAKTGGRWRCQPLSCSTCDDGGWGSDHECVIGIVRCADDDIQAFLEGATWAMCCFTGELEGRTPRPPAWGWWRWNPDWSREYSSVLAGATGPGRGNWRGAIVLLPSLAASTATPPAAPGEGGGASCG